MGYVSLDKQRWLAFGRLFIGLHGFATELQSLLAFELDVKPRALWGMARFSGSFKLHSQRFNLVLALSLLVEKLLLQDTELRLCRDKSFAELTSLFVLGFLFDAAVSQCFCRLLLSPVQLGRQISDFFLQLNLLLCSFHLLFNLLNHLPFKIVALLFQRLVFPRQHLNLPLVCIKLKLKLLMKPDPAPDFSL